eukprot:CAMPEP_0174262580 /NCGR_PEP_ID=MMETSP0439-20130205/13739_1 /TAXON_ID=0 /ORGANISM="Stereomyxa ramosa, Strain Chinc5" /LENGTH=1412 /DNA_ID=CAMNT_0015347351 /DNA_START=291 /DNA_END=4529 /DNA_ORIENTATION=-
MALAALHLAQMVTHLGLSKSSPYQLLADGSTSAAWILCTLLLMIAHQKGQKQTLIVRFWWLLAYGIGCVKIQTISNLLKENDLEWEYILFFVTYGLYVVISVLGLWWNEPPTEYYMEFADDLNKEKPIYKTFFEYRRLNQESAEKDYHPPSPEKNANWISRLVFWWFNPILYYGYDNTILFEDLYDLVDQDKGAITSGKFQKYWKTEMKKPKPQIAWALLKAFGFPFFAAGFYKLMNDILVFGGPIILGQIVTFIEEGDRPFWEGLLLVFALCGTAVLGTLAAHQYYYIGFRVGMHVRASIVMQVYRKSFDMNNAARQNYTIGEIVNHMSLDGQRLMDLVPFLHMVWSSFVQLAIALGLLWQELGIATLGGVGVMAVLVPLNIFLARYLGRIQKSMMGHKDKRNKIVNEVLTGIRVIKFFAWEGSFVNRVDNIRSAELVTLRKSAYIRAFSLFLWTATPLAVAIASFAVYTIMGEQLTASIAFTSLALFNTLRFPLNMLPRVISGCVEAYVSAVRLNKLLTSPELDPNAVLRLEASKYDSESSDSDLDGGKGKGRDRKRRKRSAVKIDNADFKWDINNPVTGPTLKNINIDIPKGALVAVVGQVGSGKSALLSAILGDIDKTRGTVTVEGKIALVTQQAWIRNATLEQNILGGKKKDDAEYEETIQVCELAPDLEMLPGGDQTEIGEKGINLSGGQKQRVSIARAVYSDNDIYLLDDPLSAVDAHVGKAIFENCICDKLQNKTRILVTHQLQHMPNVDYILVMKNGAIVEAGTYKQLMKNDNEFAYLMNTHVHEHEGKEKEEEEEEEAEEEKAPEPKKNKLMSTEERDKGSVSWQVYYQYIVAMGGVLLAATIFIFYGVDQAAQIGGNFWLSYWSDIDDPGNSYFYLGIYAALGAASAIAVLIRSVAFAYGGVNSARVLHEMILAKVVRAPMSFFDTTPVGRILNRFAKDMYIIDELLPHTMSVFLLTLFNSVGIIVVISTVTPFFLCALIPLGWLYFTMQQYYIRSSREMKRLDSISRSPIYAHFSETLAGVSTIRAFNRQEQFIVENEKRLDANQRAFFASLVANRWLGIRVEFIGTAVVTLAALFAVLETDNIDPGLAGLSITYALNITGTLNWLVRMSTEAETQLVAVERVIQYTHLETEAAPIVMSTMPPPDWPQRGEVQFNDFKLRYREGLELVLKGITCRIAAREKVGIVGRTGAGKSSLMLALFRLVEAASGNIVIDGVDISTIGLDTLRSRLSIIPQDPTLFTGTIRSNLDPFNNYSDDDIWDALKKVHLADAVKNMDGGGPGQSALDSPVTEDGENLSVGERQLMCLGRALLKKSRVLVMDEATAAVDFETDALIQKTIQEEFSDITVFTIAHRIHTILYYDRVMVLDKGLIVEFDDPQELLRDKSTQFYSMVNSSGTASSK